MAGTSDTRRTREQAGRARDFYAPNGPSDDLNFWALFEAAPDDYLVLAPDAPRFTIVAANNARLQATMTRAEEILGRPLFDVFPDNPTDPGATGVRNLQASLNTVLRTGKPHRMALQKYDIRSPDGRFEERYWDPLNSPVFDESGELIYIIHRVEDVTAQVRSGNRLRTVESILESITDAFYTLDRQWRFTYVNHRAEEILQRRRENLIGRVVWEEFPDANGTQFDREFRRSMAEQTTAVFEAVYPPLDIWVEVHAYPTPDVLSVYISDITTRKRAQEALRQSEERYRLLADLIPQHIWTTDPEGYHGYFSQRWYDFTGATLEDTKGEGWLQFLHPDDLNHTLERWQHSLRTGEPYSVEYRFRGHDGHYRWFLGQAMPQRDASGNITGWFGTLTDISERKRLDAERERLLEREREAHAEAVRRSEELESVTESRTRLMRGFTHDVKNPLGAADGYAQLLEDGVMGELSNQQRQSVGRIRRSLQRSLHLINELMELARAESGQIEIAEVPADVGELAREVAEDFRAQATTAGLELDVDLATTLPTRTDPARVRQILSNLLSNAVKYTPAGSITVRAMLRANAQAKETANCIAVDVADTGPGIPPGKTDLIFREFTRLDPEAPHGAGVGLAISRRIARILGGDITVASEVDHGSTFTLWLPPHGKPRANR